MDMREWAKEFEVVNGRKANSDEFLAAKQQGFPSLMSDEKDELPKDQINPTSEKLSWLQIAARVIVVLVVAVFGYLVGYLFA
ncbi:MAG: hypothetical protein SPD91_00125 [Streptococcus hyointestinalis]|uniref:Uncharacterized protein n=1 Tax=Streptococcus hyointestinalis TaxID=1337 RepID=A0A380KE77_9STRE|nr:hypothetical protein [Streptococcus hyointestinalis]MCI6872182.1 hypothetical protein [Streptococcus hyointestinalis]MDD7357142.1 hypothetical protein [Streptococcus hyointestinalis]MDY4552870.1 hypothetical protein [Streptococcus hyointestinalis]SUN63281.1 Uncharacterised protein [Streptococcus hyointestinalis]